MFKKNLEWIEKYIKEQIEYYSMQTNYNTKVLKRLVDDVTELGAELKIEKPTLRPAWQARIISEHGKHSRDWMEYEKEIKFITEGIDDCINGKNKYSEFTYYKKMNKHVEMELEELGYLIEYDNDATRISW